MRLIDSSAWVDYYRSDGDPRAQDEVAAAIEADEAATCGVIRVEILGFIARKAEFEAVSQDFSALHELPLTAGEFDLAVEIGRALRSHGHTVPATDLLIAAVAISHEAELVHCDRHFDTIGRHTRLRHRWLQ